MQADVTLLSWEKKAVRHPSFSQQNGKCVWSSLNVGKSVQCFLFDVLATFCPHRPRLHRGGQKWLFCALLLLHAWKLHRQHPLSNTVCCLKIFLNVFKEQEHSQLTQKGQEQSSRGACNCCLDSSGMSSFSHCSARDDNHVLTRAELGRSEGGLPPAAQTSW